MVHDLGLVRKPVVDNGINPYWKQFWIKRMLTVKSYVCIHLVAHQTHKIEAATV